MTILPKRLASASLRVKHQPVGTVSQPAVGTSPSPDCRATSPYVQTASSPYSNDDSSDKQHASPELHNSDDEYGTSMDGQEATYWSDRDRAFEVSLRSATGFFVRPMADDGNCLFRAVADQIYGDQEMHTLVRAQCMDYLASHGGHFAPYLTEDVETYVERKRYLGVQGNHVELQSISDLYARPVHIYCYTIEPAVRIDGGGNNADGIAKQTVPIRLSYQRQCHYNSICDPLCLPPLFSAAGKSSPHGPDSCGGPSTSRQRSGDVERAMLEDKLNSVDSISDAIAEQVARDSYTLWLAEQQSQSTSCSSMPHPTGQATKRKLKVVNKSLSAKKKSKLQTPASSSSPSDSAHNSPLPSTLAEAGPRSTPSPNRIVGQAATPGPGGYSLASDDVSHRLADFSETATFSDANQAGLYTGWTEAEVLTHVLAASEIDYYQSVQMQQMSLDSPSREGKS